MKKISSLLLLLLAVLPSCGTAAAHPTGQNPAAPAAAAPAPAASRPVSCGIAAAHTTGQEAPTTRTEAAAGQNPAATADIPALWISGTAVPGGVQQLEAMPDGKTYKFAGQLLPGELIIQTTKKAGKTTRYIVPTLPDALIVSRGIRFRETTDAPSAADAWQVPFENDLYRFSVSIARQQVSGEIFQPWGELFIAGGATEVGWACEGKMLLMKQDLENPCLWTWEGELRQHPDVEEPRSFKFQGQDRWHPKSLHPYRQGTDIRREPCLRTGGDDTKWEVSRDGRYRIQVDLFHETIKAELLKP